MTGYRPKPGFTGTVWIDAARGFPECRPGGAGAWFCPLVGAVASWGEDVGTLCSMPPPPPDDYGFIEDDFGLAATATRISKLTSYARANAHHQYCEKIPEPPDDPPPDPTPNPSPPPQPGTCEVLINGLATSDCRSFSSPLVDYVGGATPYDGVTRPGVPNLTLWNVRGSECLNAKQYTFEGITPGVEAAGYESQPTLKIGRCTKPDGEPEDPPPNEPPPYNPPPPPVLPPNVPPPPPIPPPDCSNCPPGEKGEKGDRGITGATGATGEKGDKGDKGDKGEQGAQGFRGFQGIQGEPGKDAEDVDLTPITNKLEELDKLLKTLPNKCPDVNLLPVLAAIGAEFLASRAVTAAQTVALTTAIGGATATITASTVANATRAIVAINANTDRESEEVKEEIRKLKKEVGELDLCVGVPMNGYDLDTYEVAVLYFSDAGTTKTGQGRYLNVPRPDVPRILQWASSQRVYGSGSWLSYIQFFNSKGVKIVAYGRTPQEAQFMVDTMYTMSRLQADDIFHKATPRLVATKKELQLNLRRITTFEDNRNLKSGRQSGKVIWEA